MGLVICPLLMADDCFELYNYYSSRPTNYTTRGGDGWMATNAAVQPTSSMYFYSEYPYVMLTGGNKNTAPGQLEVTINPTQGVDELTFLIAKPCISDYYSGAGVYVYADGKLVFSQLVTAYGLSYQQITVPVNFDCTTLTIRVTNYYTNTTKEHNNRIAFAHFCWTDYKDSPAPPPVDPDTTGHDDPPTPPVVKKDTVHYSGYICYEDVPYLWNGIQCTKTDDYVYTTLGTDGKDSTTILHLTVSPQPTIQVEHREMTVGDKLVWNGHTFIPTEEGDTVLMDSVYDSQGCKRVVYTIEVHVKPRVTPPAPHVRVENYYLCPGASVMIHGSIYTASTQYKEGQHEFFQEVYPQAAYDGTDSVLQIHIWVSPAVQIYRIDTAICQGDSFEWYGQTISEAKAYVHTIPTFHDPDCDSIRYVLKVGFLPAPEVVETYTLCPSQLPIRWRGVEYNSAGTYMQRVPAPSGCDSAYVLCLKVITSLLGDTTAWCCPADLPYQWYDQSLTKSGDYTHTLLSADGCDSIVTLHLHVRSVPHEEHDDIKACDGEVVLWRNREYRHAGTYYDTVRSLLSPYCDSVCYSMTLTYGASSYGFDTIIQCRADLPYTWYDMDLTEEGEYTTTLTNAVGCDSVVTLLFHVVDADYVTVNKKLCSAQMPYTWNGMICTAAGNYTYRTVNSYGCDSIVTLHLMVDTYSTSDTLAWICANELPYRWHDKELTQAGTAQWKTTNSVGCDSIVTLHLYVSGQPIEYHSDTFVCAGVAVRWRGRVVRDAKTYYDTIRTRTPSHCDSIYYSLTLHHLLSSDSITEATICQGETFTWHGRTFNRSIDEQEVLRNVAGCDSICTLHLTVLPYAYSMQMVQICAGDSVKVHDRWVKKTGLYTDTLHGANHWGCDSICRTKVQVYPVAKEIKMGVRVFADELPYLWRWKEYLTDGLYSDTITSPSTGCDSLYYRLDFHVLEACETKPTMKNY